MYLRSRAAIGWIGNSFVRVLSVVPTTAATCLREDVIRLLRSSDSPTHSSCAAGLTLSACPIRSKATESGISISRLMKRSRTILNA